MTKTYKKHLHALLSRGYFPNQIPLPFVSSSFAYVMSRNSDALPQNVEKFSKSTHLLCFDTPNAGIKRRELRIPNPLSFFHLCKCMASEWDDLIAKCASPLSKSEPLFQVQTSKHNGTQRALTFKHSFGDWPLLRLKARSSAKYILRTDIVKCYPSIYTHSIPWALHSKKIAKNKRHDRNLFGNKLDRYVRNCQDQQTIGLPIGPDTSYLISELVLADCDRQIAKKLGRYQGFRFVDDFEFGVQTYDEAEQILSLLKEILSLSGLHINDNKTEIIKLPLGIDAPWKRHLQKFEIRDFDSPRGQHTDLVHYCNQSLMYAEEYPTDNVLKYAVRRLVDTKIAASNWGFFENYLFQVLVNAPDTFLPVLEMLRKAEEDWEDIVVERDRIQVVMNQIIRDHIAKNHFFETAHALWALIYWNLAFESDVTRKLEQVDNSMVAIMLLDAAIYRKLTSINLDYLSKRYANQEALYGEQLMLAYEANIRNWLDFDYDYVQDTPFEYLKSQNVYFYDPRKVRKLKTAAEQTLSSKLGFY